MTEYELVEWHHQLNGHEFERATGVGDGQGSLELLQSMGLQRVRHNSNRYIHYLKSNLIGLLT